MDFNTILSKQATSVEKPPLKPSGTYQMTVAGQPELRTVNTKDGEKPVIAFKYKAIAPIQVDDQDALNDPKLGDVSSWPPFSKDIWVDGPNGEYALKQHLTATLGIEPGDKTLGEMLAEAPGRMVVGDLQIEPYTDKDGQPQMANRLKSVAAA